MNENSLKVISASRRLEMVGFYPQQLIDFLDQKCPTEKVHTIVLWSKVPKNLIMFRPLTEKLRNYEQIFLYFTITGMGHSILEPGISSTEESLGLLPRLVDFLGDEKRCCVRFDPIVHLKFQDGRVYSNLKQFGRVAKSAAKVGIHQIVISWMDPYPKVISRLKKMNVQSVQVTQDQLQKETDWIFQQADLLGVEVSGCCVSGWPISRCIDGRLLSSLHPDHLQASTKKAGGQRSHCGCTESWDIGWYYPCPGGCVYCYGNPSVSKKFKYGFPTV